MTSKSVLHAVDESTWGTLPGSPTYVYVPVDSYDGDDNIETRQLAPYAGVSENVDNEVLRAYPQRNLTSKLYGWRASGSVSLAQLLFDWGFQDIGSKEPRSKSLEWADGYNAWNVRHLGMRCDKATLSGSQDAADISISLDLIGRQIVGQGDEIANADNVGSDPLATAQTPPTNRRKLANFLFHHTEFTIGPLGDAEDDLLLRSFQFTHSRMLKPHWLNALDATTQQPILGSLNSPPRNDMSLTILPKKGTAEYDAFARTAGRHEYQATLVLKGLHQGTGTGGTDWTILTINFNRLSLKAAKTQDSREDDAFQPLEFVCLKPESSSSAITRAWSEV